MDISNLTTLLIFVATINIFYALWSITRNDFINTLMPTITYLVSMYIVANIDDRVEEIRRRTRILREQ